MTAKRGNRDTPPAKRTELTEELLDEIEDEIDMPLIKERLAEAERGEVVSWEEVKEELGL